MTRICRFDDDRLGIVEGDQLIDVALDVLPTVRWPLPQADLLIAHLDDLMAAARVLARTAPRFDLGSVCLLSPWQIRPR